MRLSRRSALKSGISLWLMPMGQPLGDGFWSTCASIVAMYLDSKGELERARRTGTLADLMEEARRHAGPVPFKRVDRVSVGAS